jgi:hypothetical protein
MVPVAGRLLRLVRGNSVRRLRERHLRCAEPYSSQPPQKTARRLASTVVRCIALEERLQGPKLPSYLPAYSESERPVKYPGEPLPRELAHLRQAGPSLSGFEPILDIEDRGRIVLAQSEPMGPEGDRFMHNAPAMLAQHIHRLTVRHHRGSLRGSATTGPHRLRGPRDSDRFLDSHGDRRGYRAVLEEQLVAVFLDDRL